MRIGIDARIWSQTGVGRYVRNLVENLQNLDTQNEYVIFVNQQDTSSVEHIIKNPHFKIRVVNIPWHSIAEQIRLPHILNQEKLDLVHFPYFSIPILYRKPFVMTMHDLIINSIVTGKASTKPLPIYKVKRMAYNTVVLSALKRSKKIIVPTQAVKEELLLTVKLIPSKIVVTHEGSNIHVFKEGNNPFKGKDYFLYVGNAYPHKNLERTMEAFKQLREDHDNMHFILVGNEDYFYKRLKMEVSTMELTDTVHFLGKVSDEELRSLYMSAKALVMPSLKEGFGLTTLEAMTLSCPVICSDIPVLREVCGDAAVYFDPENTLSIKNAFEKRLGWSKKTLESTIKKGKSRVQLFSWEKMAKETLAVYENCISIRSRKYQ